MRNQGFSKLIYLLSALSKNDRILLGQYLASPMFTKKAEPGKLYSYCLDHCLRDQTREIEDQVAYKYIWPQEPFDKKRWQKLKTELRRLIYEYLDFNNWRKKDGKNQLGVIEELNLMEDESYLPGLFQKALAKLEMNKDLDNYRYRLDLALQKMQYLDQHASRSTNNHLPETLEALEQMLISHTLKFAFVTANQTQIIGSETFPGWLKAAASKIRVEELKEDPLLEIYYWLYHTHPSGANKEDLNRLKELVIAHAPRCTPGESFDLYTGAINNINRQGKAEDKEHLKDIFSLYQSMVDVFVGQQGGRLPPSHLKNIVSLGMRLGHHDWVKRFLVKVPKMLEASGPQLQLATNYNYGVYHFHQKEFTEATRQFYKVLDEAEEVFYAIDARAYLLMCLFETDDSLGMESLKHAFKMYLRRNKGISEQHKQKYLDLLQVFGHLLNTPPRDNKRLEKLHSEVIGLQPSAGKEWLMEKMGIKY